MKTLCELDKKNIEKHIKKILKSGHPPKYFCGKCARITDAKKQVCHPEEIISK